MNQDYRGIGMTSQRTRERMIKRLKGQGIRDPRVLQVMRDLPRHLFVDEALASRAYEENALPIGFGQTISQPYTVARMTEALLEAGELDVVLEIGTGSGYQCAILAQLARRVYSLERINALLELARNRFRSLKIRNAYLRYADGEPGLPEYGPFDGILVTAAPIGVPQKLLEQLKVGGRLVIPTQSSDGQMLLRVTRDASGYKHEYLEAANFVPMLGGVC